MPKTPPPDWITEEADGAITVSFKDLTTFPQMDGTEIKSLRLREPTVEDQLSVSKAHPHSGDAEVALIANLSEQSPEAIKGMTLKQYSRCQKAIALFTG